METELLNLLNGQTGSTYISDTVNRDGAWRSIHIINDAVFATLTDSQALTGSNSIVGDSIKAGTVLGGKFTQIKLTSGIVKAYS